MVRPPLAGACCLKGPDFGRPVPSSTCTAGVLAANGSLLVGAAVVPLPLLPQDAWVDIRIFVDRTIVEVFVLGGRVATTISAEGLPAALTAGPAGMQFIARGGDAVLTSSFAWAMTSAFSASVEEVLTAGRMNVRKMQTFGLEASHK